MNKVDLLLVGGGLANTLIALRLAEAQPQLNVLLIEKEVTLGGNHTWSFHGSDLTAAQRAWLDPLVEYNWDSYEVRFPGLQRTLPGSYHSITSERLDDFACERLGERVRTATSVTTVNPEHVILTDGSRIDASAVIDGRGQKPSPHMQIRFQKFVGQVLELAAPHNLSGPIIMDATETQADGYRFFYTLPFSERVLLIEDTRYSDTPMISGDEYSQEIQQYAANQGWQVASLLREESGVLPITLDGNIRAYWDDGTQVARSGLAAALFHPATGYSLPNAVRLAETLAAHNDWTAAAVYQVTRQQSEALWASGGFYRALNRMLFLAAEPPARRQVLERFYKLNAKLIARFYAGENTWADNARILIGKPPVPLGRAWSAVFGKQAT